MSRQAIGATLFLLIIAAGILYACQEHFEHFESSYSSSAAADKAGEFDRGWLPDLLTKDATNIREWHDMRVVHPIPDHRDPTPATV